MLFDISEQSKPDEALLYTVFVSPPWATSLAAIKESNINYEKKIAELIESSAFSMDALRTVKPLGLPDWLIGAGFVRNLIWDELFGTSTELNDIDVVYYCLQDTSKARDDELEQGLLKQAPDMPWSVTNQARMHTQNGDPPYRSTLDAISYWPEKQTAIGVMLDEHNEVVVKHCFDLALQFNSTISRNPKKSPEVFENRLARKDWLTRWPALHVER